MHLKKKTKFHYQSVIVHGDDRYSSHFEAEGNREWDADKEIWTIQSLEHGKLRFHLEPEEIHLYHGQSHLRLHRHHKVAVSYQTDYGVLDLESELLQYRIDQQGLKLVYQLYDREALISKVYLTLRHD